MTTLTGRRVPPAADPGPEPARRLRRPQVVDYSLLGLLTMVVAFLWGRGWDTWYWLDEGIAVGISSHPLSDIPSLLRQESAPPLYYVLLHGWMSMFGTSEAATHTLSLIFAVAVVPAAFWAGRSLFSRRAGWISAAVAAVSPFMAFYAVETRMYSLVVLLTILTVATFAHAFVFGRRRFLIPFVGCLVLLAYTHNWGLLVGLGCAVALVPGFLSTPDRRRFLIDAGLGFGAVALLYLPWLPTLLYQRAHDLQPWAANKPTLTTVRTDVINLFGGLEPFVALAIGTGVGLTALLRRPWTRSAVVIGVLSVLSLVVLAGGWASSVWAWRYLAAVIPALFLVAGAGLAEGGKVGLAALGTAVIITAPIGVKVPTYQKSNAQAVAEHASTSLKTGDVVISPDLQLVPLLANYLPDGLRYYTSAGPVRDPKVVGWEGSMQRLESVDPETSLQPAIDALPTGSQVLLACPPTDPERQRSTSGLAVDPQQSGPTSAGRSDDDTEAGDVTSSAEDEPTAVSSPPAEGGSPFHGLILTRCEQTLELLTNDPDLELESTYLAPFGAYQTPIDAYLLVKR